MGDLPGEAEGVEQLAGGLAVIAGVQVAGALGGQGAAELACGGLQGGGQQRRVVAVRGSGTSP